MRFAKWADLEDAFGPATAIGALLKSLEDSERAVASDAAWELQDRVAHSGAVTEAAAPVVSAILAALIDKALPWRAEALAVLVAIARALGAWARLASGCSTAIDTQLAWEQDCRAVLESGLPALRSLMRSNDPETAAIAAYVAAYSDPSPMDMGTELVQIATEWSDDKAIGSLAGAAAVAWDRSSIAPDEIWDRLALLTQESECAVHRIRAALGDTDQPPDSALRISTRCLWPSEI